jgi:hypothetical protein
MKKLRLIIDFKMKNDDCIAFEEFLRGRKFETVLLYDTCGLTFYKYCAENGELTISASELPEIFKVYELQSLECGSIVNLVAVDCETEYLSKFLERCSNLKRLCISYDRDPREVLNWQAFSFQLVKFGSYGTNMIFDESFEQFLSKQKHLHEIIISVHTSQDYKFSWKQTNKLIRINIGSFLELEWNAEISLRLQNFSFLRHEEWRDDSILDLNWSLKALRNSEAHVPRNVRALENEILAFLGNDKDISGLEDFRLISKFSIGCEEWIEKEVALSKQFIEVLIAIMPNLRVLELYTVSSLEEVKEAITATERKFDEIKVHTKDGVVYIAS